MGVLFVVLVAVIAVGCVAAWSHQSPRFAAGAMGICAVAGLIGWGSPV